MEIRDWFILIFTFFIGIVTGVYFFATIFAPVYEEDDSIVVSDVPPVVDFNILGFQYGGYVKGGYEHPSFRLNNKGEYTRDGDFGTDDVPDEGVLPDVLMRELGDMIAGTDLSAESTEVPDKMCVSYADGIEYAYSIEFKNVLYELDTCGTVFENDSELGRTLQKIWLYMEAPTERRISISNTTKDATLSGEIRVESSWSKWTRMLNPVRYFEAGFEESFGTE